MYQAKRLQAFRALVKNKFDIYNSLFLNLPYSKESSIGILIPILYEESRKGLESGKKPGEILESFFRNFTGITTEKGKTDFMFRIIQYVERQVVLYDSVEDAAFSDLQELANDPSIRDFFQASDSRKSWDRVGDKLSSFSARIVFTAHPTQFYPPPVLDIISTLRTLISENKIDAIDMTLQQLGLTSLIYSKKPTPLDEAKNIIYFLRHVYYDAVGELYAQIREQVRNSEFNNPDIIKLGFWPGGDRDGNPFVTAGITMAVADELRMALMKCYYDDIKKLKKKLTFREVQEVLDELRNKLYTTMFDPARVLAYEEIAGPLAAIRSLLVEKYHRLYLPDLDLLIGKVQVFRTHFATLDIRQDHSVHRLLVTEALKKENVITAQLDELGPEKLTDILLHHPMTLRAGDYQNDLVRDTIRNVRQLKALQQKNGEEGCNRYIISNSEDPFAVLFVYAIFRWCGYDGRALPFDIIPLFETMEGMRTSRQTMQALFDIPEYRAHIRGRNEKQTIMLGYSDGTKDGGYLKANWSIFKTKEILSVLCKEHGIKAIFFDGRGGPPARGGGKTHRFYAAQSPEMANHEIQLTIQGQTITSKYGTKEQFKHNCEQLLTAGLSLDAPGNEHALTADTRQLLEEMAEVSYEKYKALKAHDRFLSYLESKSPLKYYAKANIGSRPGKRGKSKKLELSDLRAISFVGAWSQMKQNVPGYYGTGTAIQAMVKKGNLEKMKRMFDEAPFFKALMLTNMMSLSKCYFELTAYLQEDKEYSGLWNLIHDEYRLSKEMLLLISDFRILMEEEPISRESIKVREKIVLPLLVIQQHALQKVSANAPDKSTYEKIITRSLYGNINASRNSV